MPGDTENCPLSTLTGVRFERVNFRNCSLYTSVRNTRVFRLAEIKILCPSCDNVALNTWCPLKAYSVVLIPPNWSWKISLPPPLSVLFYPSHHKKQAILSFERSGKLQVLRNDSSSPEKEPWEHILPPNLHTDWLNFYNSGFTSWVQTISPWTIANALAVKHKTKRFVR